MTTERLTDEQIAELARQTARITSAPWRAEREPPPVGNQWFDGLPPHSFPVESTGTAFALGVAVAATPCRPEAEWIAAARNALPSLLAEVRAARASAPPDARPAPLPEHDPHRRFGPPDPRPTMLCPVHGEPLHSVWRCDKCPGMGVAASARPAPSAREEGLRAALEGFLAVFWPTAEEGHTGFLDRLGIQFYRETGVWPHFKSAPIEMEVSRSDADRAEAQKRWSAWLETKRNEAAAAAVHALASAPASVPERATPDEHTEDEALELLHDIDDAVGLSGPQAMEVLEHIRRALVRAASGSDTGAGEPDAMQEWDCAPCRFWVGRRCEKHRVLVGTEGCPDFAGRASPGAGDNTNREGP